jgi:symplekin
MLVQAKATILEWVWAPNVAAGVKLAAIKFLQRIIVVQTRGVSDPRVRIIPFTCVFLMACLSVL